jgi:hypothetical protein
MGIVAGFVLLAGVIVLLHMRSYTTLSPIDELQHLDYVDSASRLDPVRTGERVHELALREEACRGVDSPGFVTPSCDAKELRPEQFQELGINTASAHPPVYYVVTGFAARVVDRLPGIDSFLTAARGIGVLWLAAGLVLTYVLARRLGARTSASVGAAVLVACTPAVIHSEAVVTNDAAALVVGATVCLAALGVVRRRVHPAWLALAAFLATSVKVTNIIVVGVALLMLLLVREDAERSPRDRRDGAPIGRWRPRVGAMALTLGAALIMPVVWMVVGRVNAVPDAQAAPMATQFLVPKIGLGEVLSNVFSVLTPVQNGYTPAILQRPGIALMMALLNVLLIAALAGAAWFGVGRAGVSQLGLSTLAGMALAGPVFVVLLYVSTSSYVPIPSRYGLCLLPPAAAVLACVASTRRVGGPGLAALGLISLGLVVTSVT